MLLPHQPKHHALRRGTFNSCGVGTSPVHLLGTFNASGVAHAVHESTRRIGFSAYATGDSTGGGQKPTQWPKRVICD